jgi:hypothetical protein
VRELYTKGCGIRPEAGSRGITYWPLNRRARIGSFKLAEMLRMQVSSPESGEVAATSRKYRLASKLERTEWFLNRDASKTYFRNGSALEPPRCGLIRKCAHLLTAAAAPPDSGGDTLTETLSIVGNSQYEPSRSAAGKKMVRSLLWPPTA